MTVQECIDKLQKVENKQLPIYIDCNYCGKALEMKELAIVAVASTTTIHPTK